MQITMKRDKLGANGVLLAKDSTVDVDEALARTLVGEGAAVYVSAPEPVDLRGEPLMATRAADGSLTPTVETAQALEALGLGGGGGDVRTTAVAMRRPWGFGATFSALVAPALNGIV